MHNINKRIFIYAGSAIIFLLFWSLASLRWKTGTDWENYYDAFFYFSEVYQNLFEPGFVLLISCVRSLTTKYTVFLTVLSFLCLVPKFTFFIRYHKECIFTILLLFFCYYFGDIFAVRQNLAISITLFSTIFIIERKPLLFVLTVIIASTFHFTTILYLCAYFIYWLNLKDRTIFTLIAFSILFGILGIGGKLLNLSLQVIGITGHAGERINLYLNGNDAAINTYNDPLVIYLLGLIKRCLFIPLFIYIKNRTKDDKIRGYMNLYIMGNIIYFLFAKDLAVFARASVPFLFFEVFLLAYTLLYFKASKALFTVVFVLIMLVSLSRFNALVNSYYNLYVPYNSIFDDRIDRVLE